MLTHFAHQAINGSWHTVYRREDGTLVSVMEAPSRGAAATEGARLNREQKLALKHQAAAGERRIPSGFYSNQEA